MTKDYLAHNISQLELPIYIKLANNQCHPPARLALGDSLMVLGLLRNYGKPVKLYMQPLPALVPLLQNHPLVADVCVPEEHSDSHLRKLALPRSGRPATWQASATYTMPVRATTIDQVRGNPILAHSLYYKLPRQEDWPSVMPDINAKTLAPLLARGKPTLVLFPFNPGRGDAIWQDEIWWLGLIKQLKPKFHLLAVGANQYGALSREVDALLPMGAAESSLPNLAWLIERAHGFIGRDGGLSHLAAALTRNLLVIWDSMASYRYWAGSRGHNIILSNPESFRFPSKVSINPHTLSRDYPRIQYSDNAGQTQLAEMPVQAQAYQEKAIELFGSMDNLYRLLLGNKELAEDRAGVEQWLRHAPVKRHFYEQSQTFAVRAINQSLPSGSNWTAPWPTEKMG